MTQRHFWRERHLLTGAGGGKQQLVNNGSDMLDVYNEQACLLATEQTGYRSGNGSSVTLKGSRCDEAAEPPATVCCAAPRAVPPGLTPDQQNQVLA